MENMEEKTETMETEPEKEYHNPVLKQVREKAEKTMPDTITRATDTGAFQKGFWLIALATFSGGIPFYTELPAQAILVATALAFLIGLRICLCPEDAKWLAPVYAILEGTVLGFVSLECERHYPGIILHTMIITFGIAWLTSVIFSKGWVRVDDRFKSAAGIATVGIALLYLTDILFMYGFGIQMPLLHETGWKGILASVFIIYVAAANLLWDYEEIHSLTKKSLPEEYEWGCAFGLAVSLFWLYVEAMNLLRKWLR